MQHAVDWAGLQQELVQAVCEHVDDSSRLSMMLACKPWHAAVLAAPHLIPTAVLRLPTPQDDADDREEKLRGESTVEAAAALHPLTFRVRVEGDNMNEQAVLLTAVLAVLPPGLHELHLACNCHRLPLRQLRRWFPDLQQLVLSKNTAFANWKGAAPVLPMLHEVHLDCRLRPYNDDYVEVAPVPNSACAALQAAACVTALSLVTEWSDRVASLCTGLPHLRRLALELHFCDGSQPAEAVSMLRQLHQLQSLDLWLANVGSMDSADADGAEWINNGVFQWGPVPPLAGLPLRTLALQGAVGLPPDWRQLAGLQELRVVSSAAYAEPLFDDNPHSCLQWGEEPAPGLTALTRLEVKSVPPAVSVAASMPALRAVRDIRGWLPWWRAELAAARPDVQIIVK